MNSTTLSKLHHTLMQGQSTSEDASLSLNIVAEPVVRSTKKNENKRPLKRNKYEKRRQRAKRSLEAKACNANHPTKRTDFQYSEQKTDLQEEEKPNKDEHPEAQESSNDEETKVRKISDDEADPSNKIHTASVGVAVEGCVGESTSEAIPVITEGAAPEKEEKQNSLPEDDEERAKYLAEFHARPMELDRRAGVVLRKATKSRDSTHLFGEDRVWSDFDLHSRIVAALQCGNVKLERPTNVQSRAIPAFFTNQQLHNILLQSETGSGKTLAYLLPILQSLAVDKQGELRKLDRAKAGTKCIILCPTRELASQTVKVVENLCSHSFNWLVPGCLLGEERRKSEKAKIRKGLSLVVATPGRLLDHLTRTESLLMALKGKLEWLVLDEADRLLDMGLGEQVKQIVQRIRSNQPGSGRDGITWRSVLVSATVTPSIEKLAKETLLGGDNSWVWVKGGNDAQVAKVAAESEFSQSTPRQLAQFHMTVSAKLRLAALVGFLTQRADKGERTVVFMSTCASVNYHHALFEGMDSVLEESDSDTGKGIFGTRCPIHRLHGSVPHSERHLVLRKFTKEQIVGGKKQAAVLLCTDVAARGLNLPECEWTVQYDPPSEVADYVHRAGRVARAGKAGHSLIFLLPSERTFLDVLKNRGVKHMSALSLASTLNAAAAICTSLANESFGRSGGGLGQSKLATSRRGEAFCTELHRRMENLVVRDDLQAKATNKEANKKIRTRAKPQEVSGQLLELARAAFLSHLRAYPTKEKAVRHIFSAKALHLGHVARSFALKEPPKKLGTNSSQSAANQEDDSRKRNGSMAFTNFDEEETAPGGKGYQSKSRSPNKRTKTNDSYGGGDPKKARALLMANAAKLQSNGLDSL